MSKLLVEKIDDEKKFEILKIELELLQSRFDKYDRIFFLNRNWAITIIVALVGFFLTEGKGNPNLLYVASFVGLFFWMLELIWRTNYMDKYKSRVIYLCKVLNSPNESDLDISIYDLTNSYVEKYPWGKYLLENLFKSELLFFYPVLSFSPWIAYFFK